MNPENDEQGYAHFVKTQAVIRALFNLNNFQSDEFHLLFYKITNVLTTDMELQQFINLLGKLYEYGYTKSALDHKAALKEIGFVTDFNLPQN